MLAAYLKNEYNVNSYFDYILNERSDEFLLWNEDNGVYMFICSAREFYVKYNIYRDSVKLQEAKNKLNILKHYANEKVLGEKYLSKLENDICENIENLLDIAIE